VLNNAVSDVIFAIFLDTIFHGKLESHETKGRKRKRDREKDVRLYLNYIDSFLFALYNQSLEYMFVFFSRSLRERKAGWKSEMKKAGEREDRLSVFQKSAIGK
jgi:hypothetical protein